MIVVLLIIDFILLMALTGVIATRVGAALGDWVNKWRDKWESK